MKFIAGAIVVFAICRLIASLDDYGVINQANRCVSACLLVIGLVLFCILP
jgi:hypothetical protein